MYKTLIAASVLSLAALTPALAESVRIPYNKAELTTPANTASLYLKISDAAETLCKEGFNGSRWVYNEKQALSDCAAETIDETVRLSREPLLKAYHKSALDSAKAGTVSATLAMR
jgi:UrcA family protein